MRLSYFQFLPLSDFLHLKSANIKIISSIFSFINSDFARSRRGGKPESLLPPPQHFIVRFAGGRIQRAAEMTQQKQITGTPPV
jgi:hypothetical protein